jgi:fibronectin-binding autotransporter adhesin
VPGVTVIPRQNTSVSNQLIGRLGFSADCEDQWVNAVGQVSRTHIYGITNLHYDFDFLDGSHGDV